VQEKNKFKIIREKQLGKRIKSILAERYYVFTHNLYQVFSAKVVCLFLTEEA
jgi:hypothetical protein